MNKRLLSILLCVCLTASFLALPAAAEVNDPTQSDGITFGNTLAAGEYEVSVVKADGTLWTWGGSRWNTETGAYAPVTVPEQVQGIPSAASVAMASGIFASDFSMVITADGELWNWGSDFLGRLGREADGSRTPGKVMDHVRDVSAGYYHTAALTEDGTLWTWGENGCGQLGNGGTGTVFECYDGYELSYETLPVKVMTDVVSVSAGEEYTAAIRSDGSLWTWGNNDRGQLGNGGGGNAEGRADYNDVRPAIQTVPVRVMEDVAMVSAGTYKTYVIKTDGSLWTFGGVRPAGSTVWDEERGMFITTKDENDVATYISTPEKVMDDVVYVSSSGNTTAVIKSDGSLWTWGQNLYGMLGRGSDEINLAGRNTPEKIMDGVATVAVGGSFMAAVTYDGGVWTWGWNGSGSLGDGSNEDSSVPVWVMDGAALPGWVRTPASGDSLVAGTTADGKGGNDAPPVIQSVPTPAPLPAPVPNVVSTLILDANGGSVGTQRVSLTYGAKIGPLPTAWREGYTFDGWYTERDGGVPITEFMNNTLIGEQTVYAHWVAYRATPTVRDLSFNFSNSQSSFGYPDGFRIPLEAFQYYFGNSTFATSCYNSYTQWSGSCWGMSMTASIIRSLNDIALTSFRSDARNPADLTLNDWSDAAHTNLGGMIELNQVGGYSSPIQKTYARNKNQMAALAQEVLAYYYTGNHPVIVSIWGPRDANGNRGGHAMVGYAVYRDPSENFDRLMVYDPNFPGDESRFIALFRDAANNYIGWYYCINDKEDWGSGFDSGDIYYATYNVYYPVWYYRGWTDYQAGTITINTPNAAILDYSGNPVAQIRDGELVTDRPDVFPLLRVDASDGGGGEGVTVFLPKDYYQIVNEDKTVTDLHVTMTNGARSAKVTTEAGKILCYVDEAGETDAVLVDGGGSAYEIELCAGDEVVALSGTTPEFEPCFLARQDGTLYALGVDPEVSALTLDGAEDSLASLAPASIVAVVSASEPGVIRAVFSDVPGEAYYGPAVQWALDTDITEGTAPGFFTPEGTCTRAQALTFLWRAMGEPEPAAEANLFADLEDGAYYYKAVLWALSEGITSGTDETHFSPDTLCTNAHILTFLWRTMGEPLKTGEGNWYDDALRWAETAGIVADAEADAACPRCDAVVFLFRALG